MNRVLILLAISIFTFGCTKSSDDQEQTNDQQYDVVFNVSTFNQEIVELKSSQPLSSVVNYLYYFVFDENKELIYRKDYEHTDTNFGTIQDKFSEGNYNIVFLAMHDPIADDDEDLDGNYFQFDRIQLQDTYYKSISISVPNENTEKNLKLDRIVGKVEVIFTDKIPASVKSIDYVIMGATHEIDLVDGNISRGSSNKQSNRIAISDNDKIEANYQIDIYEVAEDNPHSFDLIINYYDENDAILGSKKISDISIARNKITRLSGELFTNNSESGNSFNLEVDTDWTEIIETTF